MVKSLVIVESPAKAKTISKILGQDYQVKASIGHVRDLPKKKLGVKVRKNFEPEYEILKDKEPIVKELREAAELADKVYLAPDPDREGEAIAWHLSEILQMEQCSKCEGYIADAEHKCVQCGEPITVKAYNPKKLHRVEFNEITKEAVLSAMKKPRHIDTRLVDAQQARRLLDRLVGYKISPLLWRKVNGRSAGRVQSVAVRIICEREEEIEKFNPKEYWSLKADLSKARSKQSFLANLVKYDGKRVIAASDKAAEKLEKNGKGATAMVVESEKEMNAIIKSLNDESFTVSSVNVKTSQRQPQPPFITSTLQREAANHLGYTVKKTMQVAQSLYEGVDLGAQGPSGLITYMRTDSTRVSQQAQDEAKEYVLEHFKPEYYPEKPRIYERKGKSIQDAHEAIRPTSVLRTPESIKTYLNSDQYKLYKLIWERFLGSQMASAELSTRTVEVTAGKTVFRASASETTFPGYTIVLNRESNESGEEEEEDANHLPEVKKGDELKLKDLDAKQHFTQPPPRYTEASLVKTLEELGIGRPSTYVATVQTIVGSKYVERTNKMLCPTKLGRTVNDMLVAHFGNIVDVGFTAEMESKLDQIEDDKVDWHGMLKEFYKPFGETLKKAEEEMDKIVILSEEMCPLCGLQMAFKSSKHGQFLGCTGFPDCKKTMDLTADGKPVPPDRPSEEICKTCNSPMLIKGGRYGDYLSCSAAECGEKRPILKTTGLICAREDCGGEIVEKKTRRNKLFFGCSNYSSKKCEMAYWYPPLLSGGPDGTNKCPKCNSLLLYKTLKRGDQIACSNKNECDFAQLATGEEKHAWRTGVTPPAPAPAL
ncbi:MAG: type I DNA topoisomerase [Candidatus Obscuribacterales bacterium]|nr:type I DNA topoisomerase [Candidatus Obscuribacterales bacterium]